MKGLNLFVRNLCISQQNQTMQRCVVVKLRCSLPWPGVSSPPQLPGRMHQNVRIWQNVTIRHISGVSWNGSPTCMVYDWESYEMINEYVWWFRGTPILGNPQMAATCHRCHRSEFWISTAVAQLWLGDPVLSGIQHRSVALMHSGFRSSTEGFWSFPCSPKCQKLPQGLLCSLCLLHRILGLCLGLNHLL